MNPTENSNESLPTHYLSLKSGKANKTGQRSEGKLHYRVLTDQSHQHIYLTITGNDGGGYYSKEIVPFEKIELCLQGIKTSEPISSKSFKKAFVGQSANNAGFLAAILRAEKLLLPVADSAHQHAVQADWSDWKKEILALADNATPYQPEPPKARVSKESTAKDSSDDSTQPETALSADIDIDQAELDDEEMEILQRSASDIETIDQDQDEIETPENLATALDKKQSKKRVDKS